MKVGSLVRPSVCCSGDPGDTRCQTALVIGGTTPPDSYDARIVRILCRCGVSDQYHYHLEAIEGKNEFSLS